MVAIGKKKDVKDKGKVAGKADKQAEPKNKLNKGAMASVFVYPAKGKGELDECLISIDGKDKHFKALTEHKLDILSLKLSDLVKQFFTGFTKVQVSNVKLAYKRVYGVAFGFAIAKPTSYKCVIAHHAANGQSAIVFNQCALMTLKQIDETFDKQGLSSEKNDTYRVVQLTKDNIAKVTKATIQLLNIKAIG